VWTRRTDIFGDGVNLAERIQTLAEPGGIAVSRTLRDVTELKVDYVFVDGGEHHAKNVSRSLHIYHVRRREDLPTKTLSSALPRATLHFQGTDLAGHKFGFNLKFEKLMEKREGLVIGRDFECDGVLLHSTVSRRHARLILLDNVLQIEDLGSTNGRPSMALSWVPARRCRSRQAPNSGSVISNLLSGTSSHDPAGPRQRNMSATFGAGAGRRPVRPASRCGLKD
jgi:hypothetical protein